MLIIDPDSGNGNFTRAKDLVNSYMRCREILDGRMGPDLGFFKTRLDLLSAEEKDKPELPVWSPVEPRQNLRKLLHFDSLPASGTPQDVVRLFFTDTELNQELDEGFRGHPAIGAAAMSLVSLWAERPPWSVLLKKIKDDIDQPAGSRIFIAASVFGGTGASAVHPIARFLKSSKDPNAKRILVGVAAAVPYFRFMAGGDKSNAEMAARSQYFSLATRSAVEFYDYLRANNDWPFDAVYWIGDSGMMQVEWALGGPQQRNPAHFVDLLAALACLEFFRSPISGRECYYSGPRSEVKVDKADEKDQKNQLEWPDIPLRSFKTDDLRTKLLQFFLAGAAHLGFFAPLLARADLDTLDYCVPWYRERFTAQKQSLRTDPAPEEIGQLTEFFRQRHFPWWAQICGQRSAAVRLFNPEALMARAGGSGVDVDLKRIANLLWPDVPGAASPDRIDAYFSDTVGVPLDKGGPRGVGAYFSVLAHAASSYIARGYQKQVEEVSHV